MRRRKKQAQILKGILWVAVVLLVLEVAWLCFTMLNADKPSDNPFAATGQQETTATEPSATEDLAFIPWEKADAKQPIEYTWEEYQMLTEEQQEAFQAFLGEEGFEAWLDYVKNQIVVCPWDEPGARQPAEYTWEEFDALTAAQQIAFQNYLGFEAFMEWMDRAQQPSQVQEMPWEVPGAKQPEDYTMEEFEALTPAQQMAFQNYLGYESFMKWMECAQEQLQPQELPWEVPGAKQPEDYTMEEFEALTPAQQMAFQNYLGFEGFMEWMECAQEQLQPQELPWEVPGAKQPEDYTMEEFEALTPAQQMAFQNYLGADAFEAWLNNAQNQTAANPWDEPGAKQPEDYTMEEFEALTPAQQMAFQDYLGEAGFEAWLNRVMGH